MSGAADRPTQPDPDRDSHVAFPEPHDATAVRPPGTGRRWGWWVVGAAALALLLGNGGGIQVGVGSAESSVSVAGEPDYGTVPGGDSGSGPAADPAAGALGPWVELGEAPPIGGTAPLTGRHRQVHRVPTDVRQLRVEVVGDGAVGVSTSITVAGQDAFDGVVTGPQWVAEAAVDPSAGPTGSSRVEVTVAPTAGTGALECRIYAGGTLVSVDTVDRVDMADAPVTCAMTLPARSP